jgi:hypothetical protein
MTRRAWSVSHAHATSKRSLLAIIDAIAKGELQSMRMRESQSSVMKRKVAST